MISVTLFVGCEDLLNEIENALSNFSATVSGDVSSTFSGDANFAHVIVESTSPQASGITIELENSENPDEIIYVGVTIANNIDGVPTGTYNYDINNQDQLLTLNYNTTDNSYIFPDPAKTNQIILTSVENTKVKGSFTFNLTDVLGGTVSGTGTFDAIGITTTQ